MNKFITPVFAALLACFLIAGCSSEPHNVTVNASQEEIDNYNQLIEQAEKEMQGDGNVDELDD